jgi:hypothetical protein
VRRAFIFLIAGTAAALAVGAASASAARPMQTGFNQFPSSAFRGTEAATGFGLVRASGSSLVKLYLDWAGTTVSAPGTGSDETDPRDPMYDWTEFDQLVRDTVAGGPGLEPFVQVDHAPTWASGDSTGRLNPNAAKLARFATAAARRYDGTFDPTPEDTTVDDRLPRVKLWQVWNEPNYLSFLRPQHSASGARVAPARYRSMVNAFSAAVKAVRSGNLVMAGGTGPYQKSTNSAPFGFMRDFLCLNNKLKKVPGCGPVRFDLWGHHPYTSGAPTRKALSSGDGSLGDMPRMRTLLLTAVKRGTVRSTGAVRFWIDEFGWDSSPPDPQAVPAPLHRRWTAELLMRMWDAGVSAVFFHQLADNEWTGKCGNPFQSGLYHYAALAADFEPKPSLDAFRFPLVAVKEGQRVRIWGRTPTSTAGKVGIQRLSGSTWKTVGSLQATPAGVFNGRFGQPWNGGWFRAKIGTVVSPKFELRKKLPNPFYNAFGSTCSGP